MNSEDFFLVTTADEKTWPENSRILFIGEWCRRYSRKEVWSKLDTVLLPYHWDDRDKLYRDYLYLLDLHEKLLENITTDLNKIHGVTHSVRYWRILLGPWLGYFTQILFDRWSSVNKAVKDYNISATIVYRGSEDSLVANDMNEFLSFTKFNDNWNHYLYSEAICMFANLKIIEKERPYTKMEAGSLPVLKLKSKIKQKVLGLASTFLHLFKIKMDIFLYNTYLNFWDEIKLLLKFRQFPFFGNFTSNKQYELNSKQREWTFSLECRNDFELLLKTLIPRQIPKLYLEGYNQLDTQISNLKLPNAPKLIWTSMSHNADDVFKAWVAQKTENGCKLVIGQHGGHFGVGKFNFVEEHDIAICDSYLSWGWLKEKEQKVKAVGQLKSKKPLMINHALQPDILLVTCILPPQSYHLYSCTISRQWLDYFQDQIKFVNALPDKLRLAVNVRIIPWEWGWDQKKRWEDAIPGVRIDEGFNSINKLIRTSRLFISTYNATTFLESFTMNVPTVIFWDPLNWELRDTAIPFFEELKRVNIFHETPESAASHVAAIWDNVNYWWESKEVRDILLRFKNEYSDLSNNLIPNIEMALRDTIQGEILNIK